MEKSKYEQLSEKFAAEKPLEFAERVSFINDLSREHNKVTIPLVLAGFDSNFVGYIMYEDSRKKLENLWMDVGARLDFWGDVDNILEAIDGYRQLMEAGISDLELANGSKDEDKITFMEKTASIELARELSNGIKEIEEIRLSLANDGLPKISSELEDFGLN